MLTVNDLMTVDPITVSPDMVLREVFSLMAVEGCRQFPVTDKAGNLVGIITDRDLRLALNSPVVLHEKWRDEALIDVVTVASCMTPEPMSVSPDTPAYRAAHMLSTYKWGALPVLDGGALVGIISVTDFLDAFADEVALTFIVDMPSVEGSGQ